jgi:hypothetical protein
MVVAEYERKGAKEEVQDPQQDGRQDAEAQALHHNRQSVHQSEPHQAKKTHHRLKEEELERANA